MRDIAHFLITVSVVFSLINHGILLWGEKDPRAKAIYTVGWSITIAILLITI